MAHKFCSYITTAMTKPKCSNRIRTETHPQVPCKKPVMSNLPVYLGECLCAPVAHKHRYIAKVYKLLTRKLPKGPETFCCRKGLVMTVIFCTASMGVALDRGRTI